MAFAFWGVRTPMSKASGPGSTTLSPLGRDEPVEPGEVDLPLLPLSFPLWGWSWVWARKLQRFMGGSMTRAHLRWGRRKGEP